MDAIVRKLMENRISEAGVSGKPRIRTVSLDPDKLKKSMEEYGYDYDEDLIPEFLGDKYGLEDGEHYQFGNGAFDILFYRGLLADRAIADLCEASQEDGEIDPMFYEDLQSYKGKPLKELLKALAGNVKLDIRLDRPNHYGTSGFGGMCNQVTWCYADMIIKEIAAGTGKYVDVYIKM